MQRHNVKRLVFFTLAIALLAQTALALLAQPAWAQDVGDGVRRGYIPNTTSNPYAGGTIFNQNGINNPYEGYGTSSTYESFNNPGAIEAPKLFDENGDYKGP